MGPISNAKAAAGVGENGGIPYLSGDEKLALALTHQGFFVTAIRADEGNEYGPRWLVTISLPDGKGGETLKLVSFNRNPTRDEVFTQLLSVEMPFPAQLKRIKVKNGMMYDLADVDDQTVSAPDGGQR